MGFPQVKVLEQEGKTDSVVLTVEQSWFMADGSELDEEGAAKKWTIPILTCTADGTLPSMTLLREKSASITISMESDGWVKLSVGQEVPIRLSNTAETLKRFALPAFRPIV